MTFGKGQTKDLRNWFIGGLQQSLSSDRFGWTYFILTTVLRSRWLRIEIIKINLKLLIRRYCDWIRNSFLMQVLFFTQQTVTVIRVNMDVRLICINLMLEFSHILTTNFYSVRMIRSRILYISGNRRYLSHIS